MKSSYIVTCIYVFTISYGKSTLAMPPLNGPFGGTLQGFRPQAQFGESIRNWFINIKDRIFGNPHSPDFSALLNQAKDDYNEQKKLIEGFWLDLTRVSFDPDRDWGFRLGPWFIIKKSNDNSNTDSHKLPIPEPKTIDPLETEWDRFDFGKNRTWTQPVPTVEIPVVGEMTTHAIEENIIPSIVTDKEKDVIEGYNKTFGHSTSDESARMMLLRN